MTSQNGKNTVFRFNLAAKNAVQVGKTDKSPQEVRFDLAPHRESYKVRVLESRDGLTPAAASLFKQAVHLTKRDPAAACRGFAAGV